MSRHIYGPVYIYSGERVGRDNKGANEGDGENAGAGPVDPKGALTSSQANIFDGLMKTAMRARVSKRRDVADRKCVADRRRTVPFRFPISITTRNNRNIVVTRAEKKFSDSCPSWRNGFFGRGVWRILPSFSPCSIPLPGSDLFLATCLPSSVAFAEHTGPKTVLGGPRMAVWLANAN